LLEEARKRVAENEEGA